MQRRARASIGLAAALIVATAAVLLAASPAHAHAVLVDSNPANGAQVDEAPDEFRLLFSERVTLAPGGVTLLDAAGATVATPPAAIADDAPEQVRLPLPENLADGTYLVSWRVVSADSHPVAGAVVFTVGDAPPQDVAVTGTDGDPWLGALFTVSRWTGYAGLTLLAGTLLVFIWCWPGGWQHRRARQVLLTGWATSVAAAATVLLLQGPYAAGRSLAAVADPTMLASTLQTDYGRFVLARLGLLLAASGLIFASVLGRRLRSASALVLAVGLAASWVGTGHSNTAGRPFDAVVNTAHLVAMAAWFGGLMLLVVCLLPRSSTVPADELTGVLRRFSTLAVGAVATLLVTGGYLAWRQVGSVDALAGTTYGRLLAFKLAALGILLWFGAMSRTIVARRYSHPERRVPDSPETRSARRAARAAQASQLQARAQLRQSVRLEVGSAMVVLAIASVLVATPPAAIGTAASAGAADPVAAASTTQEASLPGGAVVRTSIDPAWRGENQLTVAVFDETGVAWDVPEVTASLTPPGEDLGRVPVTLAASGPGEYAGGSVHLPMAGTWQLRVTVRTTEIDSNTVLFEIPVR